MTVRLLLMMWILAVAPATAQELLVRSAEHPDYSRLLVTVPSGVDWAVSQDGRATTVTFPGLRQGFRLESIFDRMPRTRIVSVDGRIGALGSTLELTLACSCDVAVSRVGSRFVAVDVRRASGAPGDPVARRVLNPPSARAADITDAATVGPVLLQPAPPPQTDPLDALLSLPEERSEGAPVSTPDRLASELGRTLLRDLEAAEAEGLIDVTDTDRLVELQDAIEASAARDIDGPPGSAGGTSTVETEIEPDNAPEPEAMPDIAVPPPPTPDMASGAPMPEDPATLSRRQITTRLPLIEPPRRPSEGEVADTCPENDMLNMRFWASDTPIVDQIAHLRRGLVADHGGIDAKRLQELAQFYIFIGFGREAELLLTHAPGDERFHRLLTDLARVVEGRPVHEDSAMHEMEGCDGRVALWRAAAGLEVLDASTERGALQIDAFSELPPSVRRIAGAEILRHAAEAGAGVEVEDLKRILDRTPGTMSASEGFARARIAVELGDIEESREITEEFRTERGPTHVDLLLLEAEDVLSSGAPVTERLFADLDIERRLRRGSSEGLRIGLTLSRLDFAANRPAAGFARIEELLSLHPEDGARIAATARDGLDGLDPKAMPGVIYAALVLENRHHLGADRGSVALRTKLAGGLIDEGLPNAARTLVETHPLVLTRADRLIRARARLESEDAAGAIAVLEGLDDEEAARLRSEAYLRLGTLQAAFEALEELGRQDADRSRMALLTQNWRDVSTEALPDKLRPLADRLQQPALPPRAETPLTLAGLASQLEEASAFREAVEEAGVAVD
ncbi:MAG: hypothetical protein AAGI50_08110 [Pseudomonadota bacterium]